MVGREFGAGDFTVDPNDRPWSVGRGQAWPSLLASALIHVLAILLLGLPHWKAGHVITQKPPEAVDVVFTPAPRLLIPTVASPARTAATNVALPAAQREIPPPEASLQPSEPKSSTPTASANFPPSQAEVRPPTSEAPIAPSEQVTSLVDVPAVQQEAPPQGSGYTIPLPGQIDPIQPSSHIDPLVPENRAAPIASPVETLAASASIPNPMEEVPVTRRAPNEAPPAAAVPIEPTPSEQPDDLMPPPSAQAPIAPSRVVASVATTAGSISAANPERPLALVEAPRQVNASTDTSEGQQPTRLTEVSVSGVTKAAALPPAKSPASPSVPRPLTEIAAGEPVTASEVQQAFLSGLAVSHKIESNLRERAMTLLGSVACGRVNASQLQPGQFELAGHVPSENERDRLVTAMQQLPGVTLVTASDLLILPRPLCQVMEVLEKGGAAASAEAVARSEQLGRSAQAGAATYRGGDHLLIHVHGPEFSGLLYVDYFDSTGHVLHLLPASNGPTFPLKPKQTLTIGGGAQGPQLTVSPPFGRDLIITTVVERSLFPFARPPSERTEDYLAALDEALQQLRATNPQFRAEYSYQIVSTQP